MSNVTASLTTDIRIGRPVTGVRKVPGPDELYVNARLSPLGYRYNEKIAKFVIG
jgi:hypothetical protein